MKTLFLALFGTLSVFWVWGQSTPTLGFTLTSDHKFQSKLFPQQSSFANPGEIEGQQGVFKTGVSKFLLTSKFFPEKFPYSTALATSKCQVFPMNASNSKLLTANNQNMNFNRRIKYSSLWAFTSLNYIYADLMGVMDMNLLNQYQTGTVNGVEVTPAFLTYAAAYMQIPLANVFLPHVIRNDRALRWVQIVSGSIATLVQASSLAIGVPTPYYILFSAIEIGVTTYITMDAIKWKPKRKTNP